MGNEAFSLPRHALAPEMQAGETTEVNSQSEPAAMLSAPADDDNSVGAGRRDDSKTVKNSRWTKLVARYIPVRRRGVLSDTVQHSRPLADQFVTPIEDRVLSTLASVRRVFIHCTSIDALGDFSAGALEILDDRVRRDSLQGLIGALLEQAAPHGPLRALQRSLYVPEGFPRHTVSDVVRPSAHAIAAVVGGSEVSIGDQEFLLERGVLIDSLVDTLVEESDSGFYLLIAIGDAIIARALIKPPRIGDGRMLVQQLAEQQIPLRLFSLGYSEEAEHHAREMGLTSAAVDQVDSTVHLDALVDAEKPALIVTSDPDCAEYMSARSLVVLASPHAQYDEGAAIFVMKGYSLSPVAQLLREALVYRQKQRQKITIGLVALVLIFTVAAFAILS